MRSIASLLLSRPSAPLFSVSSTSREEEEEEEVKKNSNSNNLSGFPIMPPVGAYRPSIHQSIIHPANSTGLMETLDSSDHANIFALFELPET